MCEYPHVVVTGASSSTGRAVTLCLAASGFQALLERGSLDASANADTTPKWGST